MHYKYHINVASSRSFEEPSPKVLPKVYLDKEYKRSQTPACYGDIRGSDSSGVRAPFKLIPEVSQTVIFQVRQMV